MINHNAFFSPSLLNEAAQPHLLKTNKQTNKQKKKQSLKADSYPLTRSPLELSIGARLHVNSFHPFPFNHQRLSILWERRIFLLQK